MFGCRNCEYEEEAENVCVYRHEIVHAPSEQTMMLADLSTILLFLVLTSNVLAVAIRKLYFSNLLPDVLTPR
ncbi:unnamed protein product [Mucor hiemalis]